MHALKQNIANERLEPGEGKRVNGGGGGGGGGRGGAR